MKSVSYVFFLFDLFCLLARMCRLPVIRKFFYVTDKPGGKFLYPNSYLLQHAVMYHLKVQTFSMLLAWIQFIFVDCYDC